MKKVSKNFKRRVIVLGTISVIAIFSCLLTLGTYIYDYFSLSNESNELENELLQLEEDKDVLKNDIIKLQNPEYIVRYAKEKFLYSENGEYVLKLDEYTTVEELETNDDYLQYIFYIGLGVLVVIILFIQRKKRTKN